MVLLCPGWEGDLVFVFLARGAVWWSSSWLLVAEFLGVGLAGLVGGSQQGCSRESRLC